VTFATLGAITVVAAVFYVLHLARSDELSFIDLLVYRAGGHAVLTGQPLYGPAFAAANHSPNGLAFLYPPFSALLFVPMAMVPAGVAKVVMLLVNAVACAVFFAVIVLATQGNWDRLRNLRSFTAPMSRRTGIARVALAAVVLFSAPVVGTFEYGQINLILAAAVALDLLLPSVRWPRGVLVGIATAVKLTPAVFIGYFLVTRQWRALAVSVATTAAAIALSWLVMPANTTEYFTSTMFRTNELVGAAYATNQSIFGVVIRVPAFDSVRGILWIAATILVMALAIAAIEVNRRSGDTVAAVLSAAFISLLCSPLSWGHHWVWLSAAAVYLLVRWAAECGRWTLTAGVTVAIVTLAAPWLFLPNSDNRERLWHPVQHVLGTVWALVGVMLLAAFAFAPRKRPDDSTGQVAQPYQQ
jgi:alpha-1,2-mannosyltransferase